MNSLINDPRLAAIYEENLLVSDSQHRYTALKNSVLDQLKPRDFIEQMWAAEIIQGEWETLQLRRFKSSIITSARRPALQNLLHLLLQNSASKDIDDLAEINRRLAELGSRRDRILQRLEDHRAGLATPPHLDQGEGNDRELRHRNLGD